MKTPYESAPVDQTLDTPAWFFEARERAGPLTPIEHCYRAVSTKGFAALVACDAVMGRASLTAEGERWLLPIVRHLIGLHRPLPLSALDWIALYHRSRDLALRHFSDWNKRAGRSATTPAGLAVRRRCLRSGSRHQASAKVHASNHVY